MELIEIITGFILSFYWDREKERNDKEKLNKVLEIYESRLNELHNQLDHNNGEIYSQILLLRDIIYILRREFDLKIEG